MKTKMTPRISNVFIEIIILVLVFSIAAVIVFRVYAVTIDSNSENIIKNNAIESSNSIISLYKSGMDIKKCIKEVISKDIIINEYDNRFVIKMDKEMKKNDGNVYLIVIHNKEEKEAGVVNQIKLKYLHYDKEIYAVEGSKYEQK